MQKQRQVQEKQNIHTASSEPCLTLATRHFCSLSSQPRKVAQMDTRSRGPCRREGEGPPHYALWKQSWGTGVWGKITDFGIWEDWNHFLNVLNNSEYLLQKTKNWKIFLSAALLPKLKGIIKICEGAIRMGECAKLNCY